MPHHSRPEPEARQLTVVALCPPFTTAQVYKLAKVAREKLGREASCPDHNLLRLVGHANLLDALVERLEDADRADANWGRTSDEERNPRVEDVGEEEDEEVCSSSDSGSDSDSTDSESTGEWDDSDEETEWSDFKEVDDCLCCCDADAKDVEVITGVSMESDDTGALWQSSPTCTVVEEVDVGDMRWPCVTASMVRSLAATADGDEELRKEQGRRITPSPGGIYSTGYMDWHCHPLLSLRDAELAVECS
ncbi:hypothetical protein B0T25DRAFT_554638 [Lasiosphaeria hispida]|uniref:Uncharacterized protein n=1 Tax=Lasiosphaeria hispida TaxID=260671 RepID=A0AAJ0H853_9PEZI|nr:hypothetical protein B0T25DRAFT_554638 [Lasiosphaeria hispida]